MDTYSRFTLISGHTTHGPLGFQEAARLISSRIITQGDYVWTFEDKKILLRNTFFRDICMIEDKVSIKNDSIRVSRGIIGKSITVKFSCPHCGSSLILEKHIANQMLEEGCSFHIFDLCSHCIRIVRLDGKSLDSIRILAKPIIDDMLTSTRTQKHRSAPGLSNPNGHATVLMKYSLAITFAFVLLAGVVKYPYVFHSVALFVVLTIVTLLIAIVSYFVIMSLSDKAQNVVLVFTIFLVIGSSNMGTQNKKSNRKYDDTIPYGMTREESDSVKRVLKSHDLSEREAIEFRDAIWEFEKAQRDRSW